MTEKDDGRTYNGWANYETWLVGLWLGNDEGTYRHWTEQAREVAGRGEDAEELARLLREEVEEGAPELGCTLYADLLNAALSEVDWYEIAGHYLDEVRGESTRDEGPCDGPAMPTPTNDPRDRQPRPGPEPEPTMGDLFGEVIHRYTRRQAIEDGVLVDVTETAMEAGFKLPVALTRTVFEKFVRVPEGVETQDEAGRLWDVLYLAALAIRRGDPDASEIPVRLHVRNSNRPATPPLITLKAVCGPGDQGEPVITIMTPDED